jgi:hypothetical protein
LPFSLFLITFFIYFNFVTYNPRNLISSLNAIHFSNQIQFNFIIILMSLQILFFTSFINQFALLHHFYSSLYPLNFSLAHYIFLYHKIMINKNTRIFHLSPPHHHQKIVTKANQKNHILTISFLPFLLLHSSWILTLNITYKNTQLQREKGDEIGSHKFIKFYLCLQNSKTLTSSLKLKTFFTNFLKKFPEERINNKSIENARKSREIWSSKVKKNQVSNIAIQRHIQVLFNAIHLIFAWICYSTN